MFASDPAEMSRLRGGGAGLVCRSRSGCGEGASKVIVELTGVGVKDDSKVAESEVCGTAEVDAARELGKRREVRRAALDGPCDLSTPSRD